MQPFPKIRVYERSLRFGIRIFRFSKPLPREETCGIGAQLRRAVLSISTNIAEGSKAVSQFDRANFINISEKSTAETQHLLLFCRELDYVPGAPYSEFQEELAGIARMLHAYRMKVHAEALRQSGRAA